MSEVKITEHGDKIKLEDMTLADIKELKKNIQRAMIEAMFKAIEPYDVGSPIIVSAETSMSEMPYILESCGGKITARSEDCERIYTPHIDIKFSKEDD